MFMKPKVWPFDKFILEDKGDFVSTIVVNSTSIYMSCLVWQSGDLRLKRNWAIKLGGPKQYCSIWSKLGLTKGIFMKDHNQKKIPFCSLQAPGPFLRCAYDLRHGRPLQRIKYIGWYNFNTHLTRIGLTVNLSTIE